MRGHVGTLQHLRKTPKGAHYTLDDLEGGLRALRKVVGHAVGVVGVLLLSRHASAVHATAIHAAAVAAAVHATHATAVHSTVHAGTIATSEARKGGAVAVGRGVRGSIAVWGGAVGSVDEGG